MGKILTESEYLKHSFGRQFVFVRGEEYSVASLLCSRDLIRAYVKENLKMAASFYLRICDCGVFREGVEFLGWEIAVNCDDSDLVRDVRDRMEKFDYDAGRFTPRLPRYRSSF